MGFQFWTLGARYAHRSILVTPDTKIINLWFKNLVFLFDKRHAFIVNLNTANVVWLALSDALIFLGYPASALNLLLVLSGAFSLLWRWSEAVYSAWRVHWTLQLFNRSFLLELGVMAHRLYVIHVDSWLLHQQVLFNGNCLVRQELIG